MVDFTMTRRSILQGLAAIGFVLQNGRTASAQQQDFARRVFSLINEIRIVNGAAPLQWSDSVAECAKQQSMRKVALRFPGHTDPERGDVAERLRAAGIDWARCAENIFMERGWDDPVNYAAVFWWYSPGHQANIMNPEFTETGVGLAQAPDGAWFATQIFLTPPPASALRGRFKIR
jgi:uncharacterized protein YkwD